MLPTPILNLLRSAFPGQPIGDVAATSGGFSNLTLAAAIGEERCVIKAATAPLKRADVRREAQALRLLHGRDLPAPALLALVEDDAWTIAVTRYVAGEHGLEVLSRAPEQLDALYHALGRLLAQVHGLPMTDMPPLAERIDHALAALPALDLDPELLAVLRAALEHPIWHSQPAVLVHSDAGLHNLLWDGQIAALLDWEWSGWGAPLIDLAWLAWTIRWRGLSPSRWCVFLSGYGAGPALAKRASPEDLRALALGQIASILARVQGQPGAWDEWQRRLHWTLPLEFPAL
ncbi:MAG TPA: phosphotransferase [Roseiflexaceae bacterium]|nr:phosphotransferase [Roseiflexaceae bacterium]